MHTRGTSSNHIVGRAGFTRTGLKKGINIRATDRTDPVTKPLYPWVAWVTKSRSK